MAAEKKKNKKPLYEVLRDFKYMKIDNEHTLNVARFSFVILYSRYTGRLVQKEYWTRLKSIMKERGAQIIMIADDVHGEGIMLFDKSLNTTERPNKVDYLMNIAGDYGIVIFQFKNTITQSDSYSFINEVIDIDYCAHFNMGEVQIYLNIFKENTSNMNARYYADLLILLDNIFLRNLSNIICDYIYRGIDTTSGQNAIKIEYDCESG